MVAARRAAAPAKSRSRSRGKSQNGGGVKKPPNKCEHLMKKRLAIAGLTIKKMKMEMKNGSKRSMWEKKERTLQLQNLELEKEIKKKTLEILNRNIERHTTTTNNNPNNNTRQATKSSRSSRADRRERDSACRV